MGDLRGDTRYGWPRADRFIGGASGRVPVACRCRARSKGKIAHLLANLLALPA